MSKGGKEGRRERESEGVRRDGGNSDDASNPQPQRYLNHGPESCSTFLSTQRMVSTRHQQIRHNLFGFHTLFMITFLCFDCSYVLNVEW